MRGAFFMRRKGADQMEELKKLIEQINAHERVSNFRMFRSEIKSVSDDGWIEAEQADETVVSFVIDHSKYLRPKPHRERS